MKLIYGKQDLRSLERAQENHFLMTDGLGGYASLSAAFSVTRCDQGVLVGAVSAPNVRASLVQRLSEKLTVCGETKFLSSQAFSGKEEAEDGWRRLSAFVVHDGAPAWTYDVGGVKVTRRMAMAQGESAVCVVYEIDNASGETCSLDVRPFVQMTPKGDTRTRKTRLSFSGGVISGGGMKVHLKTNGEALPQEACWQRLSYPDDAKDGRSKSGLSGCCCSVFFRVEAGRSGRLSLVFSMEAGERDAQAMLGRQKARAQELMARCGLHDPVAQQLALAADAFICRKEATGGMTLMAGYPLFGDWGRDTMISLPGCALASGRLEEAKSILETFLAYEKDGLVPNLFPEGGAQPMYNTVDAALLLICAVWLYVEKTGDTDFARAAWPVMERIVSAYRRGTRHGIRMDADGLIMAGEGFDQVTWMDVRIGDILPTPRHGKPVEINAYWYNALHIMDALAPMIGGDARDYAALAERVKASFVSAFYMEEKGYLRDVLSGTAADEQLRPNQIWAVTMPFAMLTREQERSMTDAVGAHLYTPCGLRTLSPKDPQYRGRYGGPQLERDLAYHQGTAWVFPLGAYYLAYLKTRGSTPQAARKVRAMLDAVEPMLREGCAGQLPEIYEGDCPGESKGCFAQAWSVGEMLRVYEALEKIEG